MHSKGAGGLQVGGKRRDLFFLEKSLKIISTVDTSPTAWLQRAFSTEMGQN